MPAKFNRCIKDGGSVRTKTLKDGRYIKICYLHGESFAGEVHDKKSGPESFLEKK